MGTRLWSRRRLLRLLTIAVPAAAVPTAIRLGVLDLFTGSASLDLLTATDSTFFPYVGQRFTVRSASGTQLELREVFKRGPASFSVFFGGPSGPMLSQATYEFEHPDLGRFPLFIVPARRGTGDQIYEAVVNHETARSNV